MNIAELTFRGSYLQYKAFVAQFPQLIMPIYYGLFFGLLGITHGREFIFWIL